jgi:hypothetical protein
MKVWQRIWWRQRRCPVKHVIVMTMIVAQTCNDASP